MPDQTPPSLPVRVFRWKPTNELQCWLLAVATFVALFFIWFAFHNPTGGVLFGGGCAIATGFAQQRRLHKRQDAQAAAEWRPRSSRPPEL